MNGCFYNLKDDFFFFLLKEKQVQSIIMINPGTNTNIQCVLQV